jgi:hypothetical protein
MRKKVLNCGIYFYMLTKPCQLRRFLKKKNTKRGGGLARNYYEAYPAASCRSPANSEIEILKRKDFQSASERDDRL